MQEIKVITKDNVRIAANLFNDSKCDEVVIILPGWFMTKDSKPFYKISNALNKTVDVITVDFRGHGKSSGFYTFTAKETNDIDAIVNYAKNLYKKIYLMGFSLGASLSLLYGAENSAIDKIIAVSPACDLDKIENHFWKKEAWLPTLKKAELKRWCSIRPSIHIQKKIKPINVIEKVNCPTLFIAGTKDPTVFPWHTEKLFKKALCIKKYELFKDCIHAEDLFLQEPEKFIQICTNWLKETK